MELFVAYHGVDASTDQQRFDELLAQGLRMTWINVSGDPSDARYAAIWVASDGRKWAGLHNLDAAGYQQRFNELDGGGFDAIRSFRRRTRGPSRLGSDVRAARCWIVDGATRPPLGCIRSTGHDGGPVRAGLRDRSGSTMSRSLWRCERPPVRWHLVGGSRRRECLVVAWRR